MLPRAGPRKLWLLDLTLNDINWRNDLKERGSSIGDPGTHDDGMTNDGTKNGVASDDVMDDNNENDDSQEVQEKADTNHSHNDDDDEEDDDGEAFLKKMMNDPSDNEEEMKGGATDVTKDSFPQLEVVFDLPSQNTDITDLTDDTPSAQPEVASSIF